MLVMGRTKASFRLALTKWEAEWLPFRNTLDKSNRKKLLDGMFDIHKLYVSVLCPTAYKRIYPALPSIRSFLEI